MSLPDNSRRKVLIALLASPLARAAGAGLLSLPALLEAAEHSAAAHHAAAALTTLDADEAREFAAIAARILPSDDTPGANEGGVIHFIDNVLGSSRSELLESLRAGLAALQEEAHGNFSVARFSELDALRQDALLEAIEKTPFFEQMRFLTLAGMFTLPEYGGNRDYVGWDLIGFDHRHAWQPPFGYYDADYMQRGE